MPVLICKWWIEQSLKNLQHKRSEQQAELAQLNEALQTTRQQLAATDQERGRDSADRTQALSELERMRGELEVGTARSERLEREKEDLLRLVDRRQLEIDALNEQAAKLSAMLRESREALLKREGELSEALSRATNSSRQAELYQEEAERYKKQADWSVQELEDTLADFSNHRKQRMQETASLQATIESLTVECASKEEQLVGLRARLGEKDAALEQSLAKARDAETALAERESIFTQEMAAKTRLADLYREGMEEARMRLEETERLLEAAQGSSHLVDERLRQVRQEAEHQLLSLKEELAERERQLSLLRGHLDELGRGEAAFTGRGDQTVGGRTLSDVYSEYAKAKGELLAARQEVGRLKMCLQDICQDIESRVPVLQMERQENERLKGDLSALSHQLATTVRHKEELEARVRRLEAETRELRDGKTLLEQQTSDLGRQVQVLLGELEGLPASSLLLKDSDDSNVFEGEDQVMDAGQLIDERLVGFRNIQELQVRNQELLRAIRELSQAQEGEELTRLQRTEQELRALLDTNAAELAELREQRQRQAALVESLVRQRDMLREMMAAAEGNNSGGTGLVPTSPFAAGGLSGEGSTGVAAAAAISSALEELRAEYELFRVEKGKSEKYLRDQADKLQRESGELRSRAAQLTAQLEFAQERYDLLKGNYEMERRELNSLRQSNAGALNSIVQHQSQMQQLMAEVMGSKETQQRLSSQLASLKVELDMTRSNERRLQQDLASMQGEKDRLSHLFASLQSLTSEHESSEGVLRKHLGEQIELLERELQSARLRIAEEVETHKLAAAVADREYRELVRRHEGVLEGSAKAKEELAVTKADLVDAQRKLSQLEQLHRRSEERLAALMEEPASSAEGDAPNQARETAAARARLAAVEDELRMEREHIKNYQEMARTAERNLAELTRTHDEYKSAMEAKVAMLTKTREDLVSRLTALQEQHASLESRRAEQEEQHETELATLRGQLEQLREHADLASTHSTLRKEDVERLQQMVEEFRTRYEQEVVAHGRDMESLNATKSELAQTQKSLATVDEALGSAREQLATYERLLEGEKQRVEVETADLRSRVTELEGQNNILLNQLESLTSRQASRRVSSIGGAGVELGRELDDVQGAEGALPPADIGATTDLALVVRYLRRQKDILQVEHEAMSIEYRRIKTLAETLQRSLDESRARLAEEQGANQWQAQMASEYKALLEKVEQLNILRESNSTLRREADHLASRVQQLETELEAAQNALMPREEECRMLQARLTAFTEEVRLVREDRDNWRRRFDQVIAKYQVDPGEVEELRGQLEEANKKLAAVSAELESTRDGLQGEIAQKNAQLEEVNAKLVSLKTKHSSLLEKSRNLVEAKKELQAKVQELEAAAAAASGGAAQGEIDGAALEALQQERDQLAESVSTAEAEASQLRTEIRESAEKLEKYAEALKKVGKMRQELEQLRATKEALTQELLTKGQELDSYKREAEMRHNLLSSSHRSKVAKLTAEIERLRSGATSEQSTSTGATGPIPSTIPAKRPEGMSAPLGQQLPPSKMAHTTESMAHSTEFGDEGLLRQAGYEETEPEAEAEAEEGGLEGEEAEEEAEQQEHDDDGGADEDDGHEFGHSQDRAEEADLEEGYAGEETRVAELGGEEQQHPERVDEADYMMGMDEDELLAGLSPAEDDGEIASETTAAAAAAPPPTVASVQSTPAPTVRSSGGMRS